MFNDFSIAKLKYAVMASFPQNNRTYQILDAAAKGNYAVGAYNWYRHFRDDFRGWDLADFLPSYNDDGVISVIRAAEAVRSPAIIQLFPWTVKFQGPHFVKYVVEAAHAASVPIAVHLDHCIEEADIRQALELPFDSIMVDASVHDAGENIRQVKEITKIANAKGIAIEAEMGRIEGGEDGLPSVDLDAVLTQPADAKRFIDETGVQFLAPSFGNVHGGYGPKGPEGIWRCDL